MHNLRKNGVKNTFSVQNSFKTAGDIDYGRVARCLEKRSTHLARSRTARAGARATRTRQRTPNNKTLAKGSDFNE